MSATPATLAVGATVTVGGSLALAALQRVYVGRRDWLRAHAAVVGRIREAQRHRERQRERERGRAGETLPLPSAGKTQTQQSKQALAAGIKAARESEISLSLPVSSLSRSSEVSKDASFLSQISYILRIAFSRRRRTLLLLITHSLFLVLRTYLSVLVARIDGMLVRDMIAANPRAFVKSLAQWFAIALPATYTNSMLKYLQSKFALSLRTALTSHVHDIYTSNRTYYRAIALDSRIDSPDQLITTDIARFCNALASLYSNLAKPVLDLVIFNYQLARSIGVAGTCALFVNYCITATIMRAVTPAFGRMAATEAKLEGDFRTAHSRLITNAEEIAFYHGGELERSILDRTYLALIKHINSIYNIRIAYNMFEDMIIKYAWSAAGLMIAAVPVFFPDLAGSKTKRIEAALAASVSAGDGSSGAAAETASLSPAEMAAEALTLQTGSRTQSFVTNKRLMISLADAGGRLMYSYKEMSELAGYTSRVYTLIQVLDDLHKNRFVHKGDPNSAYSLERIEGKIRHEKDLIRFDACPIVTPNGDSILVNNLSITVSPGNHLMITGPNGSGKTSVARVLAGLWPLFKGTLIIPPSPRDIFFIPQRPYLPTGTLRDQLIYPHSIDDMRKAGRGDQELIDVLNLVYLEYLVDREGGFDVVKEWKDVFSGGEKQRVQLARMFYHKPRFAVLDEATSAVSNDVEALLYSSTKDFHITVITISHRPTLFKYHSHLLRIGEGPHNDEWIFEKIGGDAEEAVWGGVEKEIAGIEKELAGIEALRKRLGVVNRELGLSESGRAVGGVGDVGSGAKRTLV